MAATDNFADANDLNNALGGQNLDDVAHGDVSRRADSAAEPDVYPDETSEKYRKVVYLAMTWDDGTTSRGSGAIIGKNDILTAAHCVNSKGRRLTELDVYVGLEDGTYLKFYDNVSTEYHYYNIDADRDGAWTAGEAATDLAVIGLNASIGDAYGYFDFRSYAESGQYELIGYPAEIPGKAGQQKIMTSDTDAVSLLTSSSNVFSISTNYHNGGSSGGPLIDSDNKIVGICSTTTWANRIDTEWDDILSWMSSNNSLIGGNNAPTAVINSSKVTQGASVAASTLHTTSDLDGDKIAKYEFWDGNGGASSGYFTLNGKKQNAGEAIAVTAAQLSSLAYVGGSVAADEKIWVRAYDGTAWSTWAGGSMTTTATNHAPKVVGTDASVAAGVSVSASSLFAVSDQDGDTITTYSFWDSGASSSSGYFTVNGVRQQANTDIEVAAANLSTVKWVGGSAAGSETVWCTASDGKQWGNWDDWTMTTTATNHAPKVVGTDASVAAGVSVSASSLFAVSDQDGDTITTYSFWDSGASSSSGYFTVNGVRQQANTDIEVAAANLSTVKWVGGSAAGSETVWCTASDGKQWGNWDDWTMTTTATNHAPVVVGKDTSVAAGVSVSASSLFAASDQDGDTITTYSFWDSGASSSSGYFTVNGVRQQANTDIEVAAANLSTVKWVGGSAAGSETVWCTASDGKQWGNWDDWTMTTTATNHAPVVVGTNTSVAAGVSVSASSLFAVSDQDGDTITTYSFWDSGASSSSGYFTVNGVRQQANTDIEVAAANLSTVKWVGGSAAGSETVWCTASDGKQWGNWEDWTMTTGSSVVDDYAASRSTTGRLTVGGAVQGNIERAGDTDWFAIDLTANTTYTFNLKGADTSSGTLKDPRLGIIDPSGNLLEGDNNTGVKNNARYIFRPTSSGKYYVMAAEFGDNDSGTYSISAVAGIDAAPVLLPYDSSVTHRIMQGYNGSFSHTGTLKYGIDFDFAFNEEVLAVLPGKVIDMRESIVDGGSSSTGTGDSSLGSSNIGNFITVEHDDGTYMSYMHFRKDSVYVSVGDTISAGQVIGRVGNTGYRSGTHLHINFGTRKITWGGENIVADGQYDGDYPFYLNALGDKSVPVVSGLVGDNVRASGKPAAMTESWADRDALGLLSSAWPRDEALGGGAGLTSENQKGAWLAAVSG